MTKAKNPKPDNPAQSQRFIDAAKEAGIDETGAAFDKAFKKIVPPRQPPALSDRDWDRAERSLPRSYRDDKD